MKRRKLKAAETTLTVTTVIADRVATDLPGNVEIAVMETDNPLFRLEQHLDKTDEEIAKERKQTAAFSLRDILIGHRSRGSINENQFQAGRVWQKHCYNAQVGSVRAIDFTREAVDGGKIKEPVHEGQINSLKELNRAKRALGPRYNALVWEALGQDKLLSAIAEEWRMESRVVGAMFRDALDILSIVFGLASPHMEHSMNKYLT